MAIVSLHISLMALLLHLEKRNAVSCPGLWPGGPQTEQTIELRPPSAAASSSAASNAALVGLGLHHSAVLYLSVPLLHPRALTHNPAYRHEHDVTSRYSSR